MPLIKWRDSYSVGVDEIDKEHKVLVEIVNELFTIVRDKKSLLDSTVCIDKLIQYTVTHFADEEAIMEKMEFPSIDDHKALHGKLLHTVRIFNRRIKDKEDIATQELYIFLRDWLITHILEEDMKYKEHLLSNKITKGNEV